MYTQSKILKIVNEYISELSYAHAPNSLYDPVKYVLSLGGKRIRPVLMLMAYNLYKENVAEILSPAAGLEIYHNFTLLHDDLMDKADMRRKKPTVHKVWDDNTAILSGDAMLILSYHYVSECSSSYLKDVLNTFTQAALEVCDGQQYDMDFEHRNDVKEDEYLEMIDRHRRGGRDGRLRPAGPLDAGKPRNARNDRPLLAFCRYHLDLPFPVILFDEPPAMNEQTVTRTQYFLTFIALMVMLVLTIGVSMINHWFHISIAPDN